MSDFTFIPNRPGIHENPVSMSPTVSFIQGALSGPRQMLPPSQQFAPGPQRGIGSLPSPRKRVPPVLQQQPPRVVIPPAQAPLMSLVPKFDGDADGDNGRDNDNDGDGRADSATMVPGSYSNDGEFIPMESPVLNRPMPSPLDLVSNRQGPAPAPMSGLMPAPVQSDPIDLSATMSSDPALDRLDRLRQMFPQGQGEGGFLSSPAVQQRLQQQYLNGLDQRQMMNQMLMQQIQQEQQARKFNDFKANVLSPLLGAAFSRGSQLGRFATPQQRQRAANARANMGLMAEYRDGALGENAAATKNLSTMYGLNAHDLAGFGGLIAKTDPNESRAAEQAAYMGRLAGLNNSLNGADRNDYMQQYYEDKMRNQSDDIERKRQQDQMMADYRSMLNEYRNNKLNHQVENDANGTWAQRQTAQNNSARNAMTARRDAAVAQNMLANQGYKARGLDIAQQNANTNAGYKASIYDAQQRKLLAESLKRDPKTGQLIYPGAARRLAMPFDQNDSTQIAILRSIAESVKSTPGTRAEHKAKIRDMALDQGITVPLD